MHNSSVQYTNPHPGYVYKEISYQIDPFIYQRMEERRIQIIQEFYPNNIPLPLEIINNIAIRVCTNETLDQLAYALLLKGKDDSTVQVFDKIYRFTQRRAAKRSDQKSVLALYQP